MNDQVIGYGADGDGLLRETEEKFASAFRFSAIEAEGEFIQVVVEVFAADRALVGSQKPAFQERKDSVDSNG